MSAAVDRVLIVGGGFSGMSAAIQLRKLGVEVDLVEIDPGWRSYGAGITVGGAALRAFRTIGVLDEMMRRGGAHRRAATSSRSTVTSSRSCRRRAAPDPMCPASGGIMRPVLAKILADATRASRHAGSPRCSFEHIAERRIRSRCASPTAAAGTYDLVIGADGLGSATRKALSSAIRRSRATPGQGVWRAVAPRDGVERAGMCMGQHTKAGFNPVSDREMYLFVTEDRPDECPGTGRRARAAAARSARGVLASR